MKAYYLQYEVWVKNRSSFQYSRLEKAKETFNELERVLKKEDDLKIYEVKRKIEGGVILDKKEIERDKL